MILYKLLKQGLLIVILVSFFNSGVSRKKTTYLHNISTENPKPNSRGLIHNLQTQDQLIINTIANEQHAKNTFQFTII